MCLAQSRQCWAEGSGGKAGTEHQGRAAAGGARIWGFLQHHEGKDQTPSSVSDNHKENTPKPEPLRNEDLPEFTTTHSKQWELTPSQLWRSCYKTTGTKRWGTHKSPRQSALEDSAPAAGALLVLPEAHSETPGTGTSISATSWPCSPALRQHPGLFSAGLTALQFVSRL